MREGGGDQAGVLTRTSAGHHLAPDYHDLPRPRDLGGRRPRTPSRRRAEGAGGEVLAEGSGRLEEGARGKGRGRGGSS